MFCKKRKEFSSVDWGLDLIETPKQKDSVSCGIFVCYFLDKLLNMELPETNLPVSFISGYRSHILKTLLNFHINFLGLIDYA